MKYNKDRIAKLVRDLRSAQRMKRIILPVVGIVFILVSVVNAWRIHQYVGNPKLAESLGFFVFEIATRTAVGLFSFYLGVFMIAKAFGNNNDELLLYLAERELDRDDKDENHKG